MYKILRRKELNPTVTLLDIEAPLIAKKAEPGQFIILRVDSEGERIPLTIADYDREAGWVRIIFQIVGGTTEKLNHLKEGDFINDFVGPLGVPTHVDGLKKVAVVGGGVGCAIAFPIAKKLHNMGAEVHSVVPKGQAHTENLPKNSADSFDDSCDWGLETLPQRLALCDRPYPVT